MPDWPTTADGRILDATSAAALTNALDELLPADANPGVFGFGATARTTHELQMTGIHLTLHLIDNARVDAVLLEGDRATSEALDRYVRTGDGDARAILSRARPFLATGENVDLVEQIRRRNSNGRDRPIRFVHGGTDDLTDAAALERSLAEPVRRWHEQTGDRIAYLGGAAHLVVAPERRIIPAPDERVPAAGALLREHLGSSYVAIGLTFGRGLIPQSVPAPPPTSLETVLDTLAHATSMLRIGHPMATDVVDRTRLVGPTYDATADANHAMLGWRPDWFDLVVHHKVVSPARSLTDTQSIQRGN